MSNSAAEILDSLRATVAAFKASPSALSDSEIAQIKKEFANAARRADEVVRGARDPLGT